jgi:hypothetical protein
MASYQGVAAASQAIIGLLADACPRPEFAGARFELYQAVNFQSPMEEGVSLFLYRVTVNMTRRNLPPRTAPTGLRYRPSLPVDLYYMLTAWARTGSRQQHLLGWAMRTLHDHPILPAGLLNHFGPDPNTFRPEEAVELFADSIPVADMGTLWEMNKANQQPSVIYVARAITIDSEIALTELPEVEARDLDFARVLR